METLLKKRQLLKRRGSDTIKLTLPNIRLKGNYHKRLIKLKIYLTKLKIYPIFNKNKE